MSGGSTNLLLDCPKHLLECPTVAQLAQVGLFVQAAVEVAPLLNLWLVIGLLFLASPYH